MRESGWGLYLVRALADRWGIRRGEDTVVWLEIDLNESRRGASREARRLVGNGS